MHALVFDGLSARSLPVALEITPGGLRLSFDDGSIEQISLDKLTRGATKPERIVLHRSDVSDWRLVIVGDTQVEWFRQLPRLNGPRRRTILIYAAVAVVFLVVAGVSWLSGGRLLDVAAPLVPHRLLAPIGRAFVSQIGQDRQCTDPAGQAALDRLLDRLRPAAGFVEPVQVSVVDVGWVNAFAVPGGQIVILRGLIDKAESPDEVAGVLAHELTHVQLRHPTKALIRQAGISIFMQSISGGMGEIAGSAIMLSGSRDAERAADAGALKLLNNAGISPAGLAAFFKRVEVQKRSSRNTNKGDQLLNKLGGFLSTHPGDAERVRVITAATRKVVAVTPAMTDEDWQKLRAICGHHMRGED